MIDEPLFPLGSRDQRPTIGSSLNPKAKAAQVATLCGALLKTGADGIDFIVGEIRSDSHFRDDFAFLSIQCDRDCCVSGSMIHMAGSAEKSG